MRVESLAAVRGPRQLVSGFGTLELAPRLTAELGSRVFLITDANLSEQPSYRKVEAGLRDLGLSVATFSNAVTDVPMDVIDRCVTEAGEHDPQTIVAFGGGRSSTWPS